MSSVVACPYLVWGDLLLPCMTPRQSADYASVRDRIHRICARMAYPARMRRQITDPTDPRLALLQPRPGQTVWEGWEPDQVIVSSPCTCGSGFVDRRVHARCGGSGRVSERVTL